MKEGLLMIVGPIGSFNLPDGTPVKGISLMDVVTKVMSFDDKVDTIRIQYDTPGGREDVGDSIYNYLLSIKDKYKLISEQIGMVASIGTKPWFAADVRIATRGEKFMIHNPWVPHLSGDASAVEAVAVKLRETENKLKAFYIQQTGITEEGLAPLMQAESSFGDEQAVALKFATELQEAHKIAAYNMENKTKQKFLAFMDKVSRFFEDSVLNLVVELSDGKKIAFAIEAPEQLANDVPAFTVDEAGNATQTPAPDGKYALKDGRTVTVTAGKVTQIEGAAAPAPAPAEVTDQAIALALDKAVIAFTEKAKKHKEDTLNSVKELIGEELKQLRAEIKGIHVPSKYKPENNAELVAAWNKSMADNTNGKIRKEQPDYWALMYFAKYGKMPSNI